MKEQFLEPILRYIRIKKIQKYIKKDAVLLDIGCGNGAFLQYISNFIEQGIGLDKKENIPISNRNIQFKNYEFENRLDFSDNSFNVVTMLAVLEHIKNPQKILNEIYRILKPGGILIITVPTPQAKPVLEFLAFKLKFVNAEEIKDHKNYFKKDELVRMLFKSNFLKENIIVQHFELGFNNLAIAIK